MRKNSKRIARPLSLPPASGRKPRHRLTARDVIASAEEFTAFTQHFVEVFDRREQQHWSVFYLCGQLANLARKTIEPMVLELYGPDAKAVRALQHFIGQSVWLAEAMIVRGQQLVAAWLSEADGVVIADGSGFPKQGSDSVGVARQYCGHLGKVANCQEGVFLVYAGRGSYTFLDERLYVHQNWFGDEYRERWQQCGIPDEVVFRTEPELALEMIGELVRRAVVPFRWVTADERFGQNPAFLQGIAELGKWYLAEVPADTRVWKRTPPIEPPGRGPLGRPRLHPRVAKSARPSERVDTLAKHLPRSRWKRYRIKEGSKGAVVADFAFLRVTAVRHGLPGPRQWLVFRRSVTEPVETKSYLSNAPAQCAPGELVRVTGLRWPIETTLKEGKGEVG
ncbi:MAG: IS701 family transposase, partial [Chloroflexi bacterium]|nr:IS701 family transposase [Chloroflexota bacterium]